MKPYFFVLSVFFWTNPVWALSLGPEEFQASRSMACVLAEESLGYLSEDEYGTRMHSLLDEFDEVERANILSKALGYYEGLIFEIDAADEAAVNDRLAYFVASRSCPSSILPAVFAL